MRLVFVCFVIYVLFESPGCLCVIREWDHKLAIVQQILQSEFPSFAVFDRRPSFVAVLVGGTIEKKVLYVLLWVSARWALCTVHQLEAFQVGVQGDVPCSQLEYVACVRS